MNFIFSGLFSFLLLYKYATLFVVIFTAALLLPLPVNTILLAAGAFASQGYFSFGLSVVVAEVANVLGDSAGYFLADIFGTPIIKFLKLDQSIYFVRLEKYITTHVRATVLVTRFFTTAGSIVNFLCGTAKTRFSTFVTYDALGNLANVFLFLTAGFLLGNNWIIFSSYLGVVGPIIAILVVVYILIRLLYR